MVSSIICLICQVHFIPKPPPLAKFYVYQHRLFLVLVKRVAFCDVNFFKSSV